MCCTVNVSPLALHTLSDVTSRKWFCLVESITFCCVDDSGFLSERYQLTLRYNGNRIGELYYDSCNQIGLELATYVQRCHLISPEQGSFKNQNGKKNPVRESLGNRGARYNRNHSATFSRRMWHLDQVVVLREKWKATWKKVSTEMPTRDEVPEVISAEHRCFIVLTFFSADSENMKNISADQLCFRADQLWFSLNQRCSELKNSALFQSWTALFQRETALNQRWFTLNQLWYLKHVDETIKIW